MCQRDLTFKKVSWLQPNRKSDILFKAAGRKYLNVKSTVSRATEMNWNIVTCHTECERADSMFMIFIIWLQVTSVRPRFKNDASCRTAEIKTELPHVQRTFTVVGSWNTFSIDQKQPDIQMLCVIKRCTFVSLTANTDNFLKCIRKK